MSYEIAPLSIIEVTSLMRLYGQRLMMVRHYQRDLIETDSIPDGAAALDAFMAVWDAVVTGYSTIMTAMTTTDLTIDALRAQWIYPTRFAYRDVVPAHTQGVLTAPSAPQNSTAVTTLKSDFGGRSGRGNVFISGFQQIRVTGGLWDDTAMTNLDALATFLGLSIGFTADMPRNVHPVILHRALPSISAAVTGHSLHNEIRTMRRRTVGRGI